MNVTGYCFGPWTFATYMIAGQRTPGQLPGRVVTYRYPEAFAKLIEVLVNASVWSCTEAQRRSWLAWREDRLFPTGQTPLLNAAAALAELNEFTDENHGYELRQVSEIKRETAPELTGHGPT
jgi:hypothetical protein